jgi:hypothetical protein
MRTQHQYADIVVPRAESVEDAIAQVDAALNNAVTTTRLLKGVSWSDLGSADLVIVEGAEEDHSE